MKYKYFDCSIPAKSVKNPGTYLVGFEFDGTACFRKGTCFGPKAIREVSDNIETYSPYLDGDLTEKKFYDLGDIPVPENEDADETWVEMSTFFEQNFSSEEMKKGNQKIFTLGGEHSISHAPIKMYLEAFSDLVLIHLDAHADLRDGYEGHHYSHASIIKRSLDHFGAGHQLIQYGVRSGTKEEFQWMKEHKTIIENRKDFLHMIREIDPKRPIYLTLDLDYFDPAFLPGTGTPEPGGEDFHSFISLLKILKHKNLVGVDVVELSPPLDATGNSDVFAAKVVLEILLTIN
jgi:agmatinase